MCSSVSMSTCPEQHDTMHRLIFERLNTCQALPVSYAYQGSIYLIKHTAKTVIIIITT